MDPVVRAREYARTVAAELRHVAGCALLRVELLPLLDIAEREFVGSGIRCADVHDQRYGKEFQFGSSQ
jgi:hypothetical protein